jgi:hypothetical protein
MRHSDVQQTRRAQASNPATRLFALLRAFKQAKKMQFGELILYVQVGKITRYKIKKSRLNEGAQQSNIDVLKDLGEDTNDFETIVI